MKLNTQAVKILMAKRGIDTQRELATLIGISENAVSDLMKGKRVPNLETIGAICNALDCTPNDILELAPKAVAPTHRPLPIQANSVDIGKLVGADMR